MCFRYIVYMRQKQYYLSSCHDWGNLTVLSLLIRVFFVCQADSSTIICMFVVYHLLMKLYSYYISKKKFLGKAQTEFSFYLFYYWSVFERVHRFQFKINLLKLIYTKICNREKQSFVPGYRHDAGTKIYLYKDFIFLVCKMCKMENKYQNTLRYKSYDLS